MNKEYFMNRLANGENMDAIGAEIAAMMNAAMAEHNARIEAEKAKAAEAEKEQAKRELIEELVEIVQELAILEGMDPDELQVTEEDMDQMVAAFTEMFDAMRELKKVVAQLESVAPHKATAKIVPNDDQILADFIKMFN
jgi:tetrahydromethanopterin S-methyltransferase subunit B